MWKEITSFPGRNSGFYIFLLISLLCTAGNLGADTAELSIKAQMEMKYDTLRFQVSPGQKVKVRLVNVDEIPHNIVFAALVKNGSLLSKVRVETYELVSGNDMVVMSNLTSNSDRNYRTELTPVCTEYRKQ